MGGVRKFAQIESGRIHWLFVADEPPEFHPSVKIVEVTDCKIPVFEGQAFDEEAGVPIAPTPKDPPKQIQPPAPARALFTTPTHIKDNGEAAIEEIGYFGNVWVRKQHYTKKGDTHEGHTHHHDHITVLARGSVMVQVEGQDEATIFHAPTFIPIRRERKHKFTALEDDTLFWCVYALRDDDGNVTEIYSGKNDPYGTTREN